MNPTEGERPAVVHHVRPLGERMAAMEARQELHERSSVERDRTMLTHMERLEGRVGSLEARLEKRLSEMEARMWKVGMAVAALAAGGAAAGDLLAGLL